MGLSWLMWMRKREVASKPHIHSSGFSHCQAGVRSLRGVTSRKGSPETIIWGHLHLCCLGRLSTYQSLRNWHITPVFLGSLCHAPCLGPSILLLICSHLLTITASVLALTPLTPFLSFSWCLKSPVAILTLCHIRMVHDASCLYEHSAIPSDTIPVFLHHTNFL